MFNKIRFLLFGRYRCKFCDKLYYFKRRLNHHYKYEHLDDIESLVKELNNSHFI